MSLNKIIKMGHIKIDQCNRTFLFNQDNNPPTQLDSFYMCVREATHGHSYM